jgi:hypothetical protein
MISAAKTIITPKRRRGRGASDEEKAAILLALMLYETDTYGLPISQHLQMTHPKGWLAPRIPFSLSKSDNNYKRFHNTITSVKKDLNQILKLPTLDQQQKLQELKTLVGVSDPQINELCRLSKQSFERPSCGSVSVKPPRKQTDNFVHAQQQASSFLGYAETGAEANPAIAPSNDVMVEEWD